MYMHVCACIHTYVRTLCIWIGIAYGYSFGVMVRVRMCVCVYMCVCVCMCTYVHAYDVYRVAKICIGFLKLQVSFRKRAPNYRALLRVLIYKDNASYASSPPCIWIEIADAC